jgi:hypothetical protein
VGAHAAGCWSALHSKSETCDDGLSRLVINFLKRCPRHSLTVCRLQSVVSVQLSPWDWHKVTRLMCTLHRRHTSRCDGKTHSSETCHANDLSCVIPAVTICTIAIKSWMHQQKLASCHIAFSSILFLEGYSNAHEHTISSPSLTQPLVALGGNSSR